MFFQFIWLISLCSPVFSYVYETPLAESLYNGKCNKNSRLLNDCNWCYCGEKATFMCAARLCSQVDVFQHFKENIQEMHVGMEGHGVWRSSQEPSCQPGMQYVKENVSCICDQDGMWPNKVCNKLFKVLYEVQITGVAHPSSKMYCNYTNLYLIGCNACFCPKSGRIDPELCTNKTCSDDDPALAANRGEQDLRRSLSIPVKSIYATCTLNKEYKMDCRTCKCVAKNTLVCGDCNPEVELKPSRHICFGHRRYTFVYQCNICFCGDEDLAMCTDKRCLNDTDARVVENTIGLPGSVSSEFVKAPAHDKDCILGTKYLKKCHVCHCMELKGVKVIDCQIDTCVNNTSIEEVISSYCIPGTYYEIDCLYCHCFRFDDMVWQRCVVTQTCSLSIDSPVNDPEPVITYSASNGNSAESSESDDLILEVIRMFDYKNVKCEPDTAYKLECNYCICLSNGNAMCTFFTCK